MVVLGWLRSIELRRGCRFIALIGATVLAFLTGPVFRAEGDEKQERTPSTLVQKSQAPPFEAAEFKPGFSPGDIEQLKDGRLLMCVDVAGQIEAMTSSDEGKTWSKRVVLVPRPEGDAGYFHPSLTRIGNDEILLSYQYYVKGTRPVFKVTYYRRSKDEGKTWGDQLFMAMDGAFNDKPVRLSTGRILVPVEQEAEVGEHDHQGYVSYTYYSDDNGMSWRPSENKVRALPVEAQEPHVIELKNGHVLMLCRTYHRYVIRSLSTDGGRTWGPHEPIKRLTLSPWSSAIVVKRIPSTGDLLLLRTSGGEGSLRTPFVSILSADEGKTWDRESVIAGDPNEVYGYPCLTFVGDTAVVGYSSKAGARVARIGTKWFYGEPKEQRREQ